MTDPFLMKLGKNEPQTVYDITSAGESAEWLRRRYLEFSPDSVTFIVGDSTMFGSWTWDIDGEDTARTEKYRGRHRYRPPVCTVGWGSHACEKRSGHRFGHRCCCRWYIVHLFHRLRDNGCVGRHPYYGEDTNFYVC